MFIYKVSLTESLQSCTNEPISAGHTILIRVLQRNRINRICVYKEISYKEFVHRSMEAGKAKICSMGWQAQDPGELMVQMKSKGHLLEIPLTERRRSFCSLQAFN